MSQVAAHLSFARAVSESLKNAFDASIAESHFLVAANFAAGSANQLANSPPSSLPADDADDAAMESEQMVRCRVREQGGWMLSLLWRPFGMTEEKISRKKY